MNKTKRVKVNTHATKIIEVPADFFVSTTIGTRHTTTSTLSKFKVENIHGCQPEPTNRHKFFARETHAATRCCYYFVMTAHCARATSYSTVADNYLHTRSTNATIP